MLSKEDIKNLESMEKKWSCFQSDRTKRKFESSTKGKTWLSMVHREWMINELLRIYRKFKKKRIIYEYI